MSKRASNYSQHGFSHVFVLVLVVIVILGVIGFAGWRVMSGKEKDSAATYSR